MPLLEPLETEPEIVEEYAAEDISPDPVNPEPRPNFYRRHRAAIWIIVIFGFLAMGAVVVSLPAFVVC